MKKNNYVLKILSSIPTFFGLLLVILFLIAFGNAHLLIIISILLTFALASYILGNNIKKSNIKTVLYLVTLILVNYSYLVLYFICYSIMMMMTKISSSYFKIIVLLFFLFTYLIATYYLNKLIIKPKITKISLIKPLVTWDYILTCIPLLVLFITTISSVTNNNSEILTILKLPESLQIWGLISLSIIPIPYCLKIFKLDYESYSQKNETLFPNIWRVISTYVINLIILFFLALLFVFNKKSKSSSLLDHFQFKEIDMSYVTITFIIFLFSSIFVTKLLFKKMKFKYSHNKFLLFLETYMSINTLVFILLGGLNSNKYLSNFSFTQTNIELIHAIMILITIPILPIIIVLRQLKEEKTFNKGNNVNAVKVKFDKSEKLKIFKLPDSFKYDPYINYTEDFFIKEINKKGDGYRIVNFLHLDDIDLNNKDKIDLTSKIIISKK